MSGTEPNDFPTPEPAPWEAFPPTDPAHTRIVDPADVPQPELAVDEAPEAETAAKPRLTERLGTNRKRTSGVRQLTKKDLDQLRGYYGALGFMLMPFNQRVGTALADSADQCVDAWEELAKQNDRVRRMLLGILEGGAWGLVLSAHIPIIWAAIPEGAMDKLPLMFGKTPDEATEAA